MNISAKTLLTKLLPALAVPVILLTSATADAAQLDISNGFRGVRSMTTSGWTFSMAAAGVVTHQGQEYPSSISLDCELDTSVENFDCVGELKINGVSREIMTGHDNGVVYWSIEADAPALFNDIHEQWGQSVVPSTYASASGWGEIQFYGGGQWRTFYYSESWADTYESISGLQYGDIWEM